MAAAVDGREDAGLSAARPVVYANLAGHFSAACGEAEPKDLAVLFLRPWGLEEFLTRQFFRYLAERFAANGIASLRFDYPGTANALDDPAGGGLDSWRYAIERSADELRALSGVKRIVVIGQGLGAGLACEFAARAGDISALALLAPVFKGRGYLRELKLWSRFVDDGLGLQPEERDSTPGSLAGIAMPESVASDLRSFNALEGDFRLQIPVLLASRPEAGADPALMEKFGSAGCALKNTVYRDYGVLLTDASPPVLPVAFADDLVAWLKSLPGWHAHAARPAKTPEVVPLVGEHFSETPLRFGENHRLAGTLCEPAGRFSGVTVVILSTSYDYQIGWGRMNVQLARRLAEKGVATLRFDGAGIGDSPPVPRRKLQVLYDDSQIEDAEEAWEMLCSRGLAEKAMVLGRCSGAYTAFRAALHDARWKGCISINPYGFHWRFIGLPHPLKEYWTKFTEPGLMARIRDGRIDLKAAAVNIAVRMLDRAVQYPGKLCPWLPKVVRRNRKVHQAFRKLADRGTRMTIVYSEGDEAMETFLINFGDDAEGLAAFPNTRLHFIANADHNLTPGPAREKLFRIVEEEALALAGADSASA
ncbi:alpha/beta hydrolase [Labrenzia sp. 011]|uniref:serine aminopeptidase domain-containing protein n=1 Tax=Labrenzia sp. 011 TaxID=2171494 RepID=UPI001402000D|nr:alpha/beta hydrolase [Labrenzia sp. 011]